MNLTVMREIAEGAKVAPDARIGPYCTIGPEVVIGPRTVLERRVTVAGRTTIGSDNLIQDGCVLGTAPQDVKYRGEPTYLIIGDRNHLGPNITIHAGTEAGGYLTRIGSDNVLDARAHISHDCYVDDRVHLGQTVLLAGHIRIQTGAVLAESAGVHHFTTIGAFSRVGPRTPVTRDVPPFTFFTSMGYYARPPAVKGVHEEGLAAAGVSADEADALRQAVKYLFEDKQAILVKIKQMLEQTDLAGPVKTLCEFCLRSFAGHSGRYRETLRGKTPPEAHEYLRSIEGAEAK